MTTAFSSALRRGKAFLTPTSSSTSIPLVKDGFAKAPEGSLFPKVDPAVDGEDCDHDCESCSIKYPAKFKIDENEKLYGHVNGWATHMLVATGKTDWVRDVSDEKGSVMEADQKLMLSASNMPLPPAHHSPSDPTTVLLLPSFTIIENVTPKTVPALIEHHINSAPTSQTPLPSTTLTLDSLKISEPSQELDSITQPSANPLESTPSPLSPFTARPCPHRYLILLCSQRTRDARCGQSAPLLRREFERHLRPLGLYRDLHDERPGGVGIYFISHVGGHKFAANVMIYRRADVAVVDSEGEVNGEVQTNGRASGEKAEGKGMGEGSQCIWLARVRPEDCEGIVKFTVLKGKVVKPERQLRGGFDRERGLVSW
ncbi:MAG: hypothetical protein Q9179_006602 [Wetmoreana sp. 5 TL-2023]